MRGALLRILNFQIDVNLRATDFTKWNVKIIKATEIETVDLLLICAVKRNERMQYKV